MNRTSQLLVVVRHGKAESGEEGNDHERRLTGRGLAAATAAGQWLVGRVDRVDHVWVSSATRAQQTWAGIAPALPEADEVSVDRGLYLAGAREVLEHIASDDLPVRVVVGHNPTLEQVVMALTGDLHGLRPGAVALVEVAEGKGRLVELWQPPR